MEPSYINMTQHVEDSTELDPQRKIIWEHAMKTAVILHNKLKENSYLIFSNFVEHGINYTASDMDTIVIEFNMSTILKVLENEIYKIVKNIQKESRKNFLDELGEQAKGIIIGVFEYFEEES